MNWISVKDKLPEHMQHVLTITKDNRMYVTCKVDVKEVHKVLRKNGIEPKGDGGNGSDFCSVEVPGMTLDNVTHWMPLPRPPLENLQ